MCFYHVQRWRSYSGYVKLKCTIPETAIRSVCLSAIYWFYASTMRLNYWKIADYLAVHYLSIDQYLCFVYIQLVGCNSTNQTGYGIVYIGWCWFLKLVFYMRKGCYRKSQITKTCISCINFQLQSLNDDWITKMCLKILKGHIVLDYSLVNLEQRQENLRFIRSIHFWSSP